MLNIPRKATLAKVGETIVSRCFVGCLGQARKHCSNRCCCSPRNYASDVQPTDPLAAGAESPGETLASGVVFCTATAGLKYIYIFKPSDRGGSSLVRHLKCLTFLHRTFDVEKNVGRQKWSLSTSNSTSRSTLFHISLHFVAAKNGPKYVQHGKILCCISVCWRYKLKQLKWCG